MEIVTKQIKNLIFSEYNPRKLSAEQEQHLTDSIKRFGIVDPIIVNIHPDRKNIVIGGHQRIKIAKKLEYKEIPCVEVKLDREKERELNIRLNKNNGSWDWNLLEDNFESEELIDWGFDDLEFNKKNITEPKEVEIKGYKTSHILLSFAPEKIIKLQKILKPIIEDEEIEIEQSSN